MTVRIRLCSWFVGLVGLLAPCGVGAEEAPPSPPARLDPVVVTATKVDTPVARLGASVTVLTAEDLRAYHYDRVEDVLVHVPGVEVLRQGGPGKATSVSVRGSSANQIQVMIDGVRVKSPTLGQFDFAELTLDGIDRIEIVRGPQSTLHGADAIGGVINVITRKGTGPPSGYVSVEAGSWGTFRETAGVSGAYRAFNFSLDASKLDTKGQQRTFRNDDSDQRTVSTRLGVELPGKGTLSLSGRYTRSDIDVPFQGFAPFSRDPDAQQQTESYLFNLGYEQPIVPWWRVSARMGQYWNNQGNQNGPLPEGDFPFRSQVDTRRREFEILSTWDTGPINTVTLGLEHRNEFGWSRATFRAETNTRSLFVQDELRLFGRVVLGGGVRLEDNDTFGSSTTPRVSIAVPIKETDTKLRGGWAKGFRAPTINDLFFPDLTGGFCPPFGNPDLEPERSRSWEVGADQRLADGRVRLGFTYFRTSFEDLITTVFPTAFCAQAGNVGRAHSEGQEFTVELDPLDRVSLSAAYTHLDTRNDTTGDPLPRHARHRASATVTVRPVPRLSLFAQWHLVTTQYDNSVSGENPGYYRVDAGGAWRLLQRIGLLDRLDLTLRVQNLTDVRYEEVRGYVAQGFTAMIGLKAAFR